MCLTPFASASSPHCFQYVEELDSSPSIIVDPCEKKCTGVKYAGPDGEPIFAIFSKLQKRFFFFDKTRP